MAQVYKCDACGEIMNQPFVKSVWKDVGFIDQTGHWRRTKRVAVDLCEECWHGLYEIARNVAKGRSTT